MAYADNKAKLNPTSLTATIVINGAVFGTLLMAAPEFVTVPETILKTYPVVERTPPEPVVEPPRPNPERANEAVFRPDPVIETPALPDTPVVTFSNEPIIRFDPSPGIGTSVIDKPVTPPAAPVMTGAEIDPRYMRDFQPPYPPSKIRMEQEGRVTVRILVGTNGRVLQIAPVGNADGDFFAATKRQALSKWRFRPATRDGVAIEAWRQISVRFELNS